MSIFINWSNHPFEKWDPLQFDAAKALGHPVFIPFPNVEPDSSIEEIVEQAHRCVQELMELYSDPKTTIIMVQGEMTLLYHILKLLEQGGYRVVAATSERDVKQLPDGTELKSFHFVAFRDYFLK